MMTTNVNACPPLSTKFQSTPILRITNDTMPSDGLNRKLHSTPATAGAIAYGQISSVL